MPGPTRKPANRRQRRNTSPDVGLVHRRNGEPPRPPTRLLKATRDDWYEYWESDLALAVEVSTDLPAIRRLFTLRDERERAYRAYRKDRVVKGSQGQPVLNPLAKQMASLDTEIRQLEDRLGLTPKSRAQLGITLADAQRTLDDLNAGLEWDEEADPRLKLESNG